jgi:hypothetical protein
VPEPSPIESAALRSEDGKQIWTGRNHELAYVAALKDFEWDGLTQGFVDEAGVFLTRSEAYDRAVQCGQIVADGGERYLISEMLRLEQ